MNIELLQKTASKTTYAQSDFDRVTNNGNGWTDYNTAQSAARECAEMRAHNKTIYEAKQSLLALANK